MPIMHDQWPSHQAILEILFRSQIQQMCGIQCFTSSLPSSAYYSLSTSPRTSQPLRVNVRRTTEVKRKRLSYRGTPKLLTGLVCIDAQRSAQTYTDSLLFVIFWKQSHQEANYIVVIGYNRLVSRRRSVFYVWWKKVTIRHIIFNTHPHPLPSAAFMRQWIGLALGQIMACRLFGAKPLSKPMLGYCQLNP